MSAPNDDVKSCKEEEAVVEGTDDCPSDAFDCFEGEELEYEFVYDRATEDQLETFDSPEDEDEYYRFDYEPDLRAFDILRAAHIIRTKPRHTELAINVGRPYPKSTPPPPNDDDAVDAEMADLRNYEDRFPTLFQRLVDALHTQQHLYTLCLARGNFSTNDDAVEDDYDDDIGPKPNDADLERLFGTVLPSHPSLRILRFTECCLDAPLVRLLTTSIPSQSFAIPRCITFHWTPLDIKACRYIQQMLIRDVRVHTLRILNCDVQHKGWKLVCDGVGNNRHINTLCLHEGRASVRRGAISHALQGSTSRLMNLSVGAKSWTDAAFVELMESLCINDTVTDLTLDNKRCFHDPHLDWIQHLLTFHNLTLSTITLLPYDVTEDDAIAQLVDRNCKIAAMHKKLRHKLQYTISNKSLWPHVIKRLGLFVTPIYRFLRIGNIEMLADHLTTKVPVRSRSQQEIEDREWKKRTAGLWSSSDDWM